MKRKTLATFILALSLVFCSLYDALSKRPPLSKAHLLQEINPLTERYDSVFLTEDVKDIYHFDFSYGSTYESLQLPDRFLEHSTTEELAAAVFSHPRMHAIVYYSKPEIGFQEISPSFNGIRELLKRNDVSQTIVGIYTNIPFMETALPNDDVYLINSMFIESIELTFVLDAFDTIYSSEDRDTITRYAQANDRMRFIDSLRKVRPGD